MIIIIIKKHKRNSVLTLCLGDQELHIMDASSNIRLCKIKQCHFSLKPRFHIIKYLANSCLNNAKKIFLMKKRQYKRDKYVNYYIKEGEILNIILHV